MLIQLDANAAPTPAKRGHVRGSALPVALLAEELATAEAMIGPRLRRDDGGRDDGGAG